MTCPNSARVLLTLAGEELRTGTVMLGHGNHPTATQIFPKIGELILLAVAC
jgi:hypothetical protein